MQWDGSLNAGFSEADPAKLYAPVIKDEVYGYQRVNVAAQEADPDSLLNRLRHMIRVRKEHALFGRGDFAWKVFNFDSKAVVAYQRTWQGERVVVLNNLRGEEVSGWIPETAAAFTDLLTGETILPGDYTLAPYAFVWLKPLGPDKPNVPTGPNAPQPGYLGSDKQ
jgi:maltose alpha-D-glucosyltransferase/alpha-amylase